LGRMYRSMLVRLVGANGKGGMIRALGTLSKDIGVALLSLTKSIGSTVFKSLNYVGGQLVTVAQGLLRTLSVGLMGSFGALGKAFTAMKVFIMTRMVPAITGMIASMVPALILAAPFIVIGLKVAAIIGTILFGLKKAFDTFKEAVEDGDDMYAVILKSVTSFFGNIIGIIPTLVKNLAAFVVGLFGADELKKKIKNMDIGQMISDALFNLTNTFLNFVNAISRGTVAALLAIKPGKPTPYEAFMETYDKVIEGKTPNIKRPSTKKEDESGEDGEEKFVQTKFMTNTSKLEAVFQDKTITNSEMLKKTDVINKLNTERKILEDAKAAAATAAVMTNIKQGDNINIKKEEYISTQLDQNNTDLTNDLLNESP